MTEPFRRVDDHIVVEIPEGLREWLRDLAERTAAAALDPSAAAHHRLLGPIDPSSDHDDPLVQLSRQMGVEGSLGRLIATCHDGELNEDDAEEWIRAFQLMLAALAAQRGVHNTEDREQLSEAEQYDLITLQSGISLLIEALDS